ncbi:hypothetical protein OF83DRAFT_1161016 [Amylostereum chailletii]|nr:hypothetical protein OF83DRAFT_1161016 [Amylostereum chailletii]
MTSAHESIGSPTSSTTTLSSTPTAFSRYPGYLSDFHGLPSNLRYIYRTGHAWRVWYDLGVSVYRSLGSVNVRWSTIDPVHFAEVKGKPGPLRLWIGVKPGTLSLEDAKKAAEGCKCILASFPDVEVAFRESFYKRLLKHVFTLDSTVDVRGPFTSALGLKTAPKTAPHHEGTGALYFCEESGSSEVLALTVRHVALPPPVLTPQQHPVSARELEGACSRVLLLGTKAYDNAVKAILTKIGDQLILIDAWEDELRELGEAADGEALRKTKAREDLRALVEKAKKTIAELDEFHGEVTKHGSITNQRVLGYVLHAPPIFVGNGPQMFIEDWAIINIYCDKINWDDRIVLGQGTGLLQVKVKGFVSEREICQPQQRDGNGEECMIVLKNGSTIEVTFGRGTGLESFTSMEFAVYSYGYKAGPFWAPGDSGSIIVGGQRRIVALLSGGTGASGSTGRIQKVFPNCYLYPMVD